MDYTTNLNLKKPNGEVDGDFADIADINENMGIIDGALGDHIADTNIHVTAEKRAAWDNLKTFQTAGGTGTAITLTGIELTTGFQTTFVVKTSNSGAATTINTKPLYKPGTTTSPKLIAGKAATVWYNLAGDCFFIKASAEGTATAEDVLAPHTFSNDDDIGLIGTLALTGDAVADDVFLGKTFYKNDPKTKLTGTNPYKGGSLVNISDVHELDSVLLKILLSVEGSVKKYGVLSNGSIYVLFYYSSSNYIRLFTSSGTVIATYSAGTNVLSSVIELRSGDLVAFCSSSAACYLFSSTLGYISTMTMTTYTYTYKVYSLDDGETFISITNSFTYVVFSVNVENHTINVISTIIPSGSLASTSVGNKEYYYNDNCLIRVGDAFYIKVYYSGDLFSLPVDPITEVPAYTKYRNSFYGMCASYIDGYVVCVTNDGNLSFINPTTLAIVKTIDLYYSDYSLYRAIIPVIDSDLIVMFNTVGIETYKYSTGELLKREIFTQVDLIIYNKYNEAFDYLLKDVSVFKVIKKLTLT